MTKAEKVAVTSYPHGVFQGEEGDSLRAACMLGYGQAEKDLALTWEDMRAIYEIFDAIDGEHKSTFNIGIQKYFDEALRRYQELKAEKK